VVISLPSSVRVTRRANFLTTAAGMTVVEIVAAGDPTGGVSRACGGDAHQDRQRRQAQHAPMISASAATVKTGAAHAEQ
jgi:hypothetical protein